MNCAYFSLQGANDLPYKERMKSVCTFFISQLNYSLIGYKPFNPILGETFQSTIFPPKNVEELNKKNKKHNNFDIEDFDLNNPLIYM